MTPPPEVTENDTATPGSGVPSSRPALTAGETGSAVPALPTWPLPAATTSVAGIPCAWKVAKAPLGIRA